jgi:O-succinylbenzoic acid--CoA ligase
MPRLIAIGLPPGPAFADELRRAFDDGDAVLPVDSRLGRPARDRLLAAMRPAAIAEAPGERRYLEHPLPVEPGDRLVMATSGTTGTAKGVVLTEDAIAASAAATNARLEVEPSSDRWWACLPLAHIGGLSVVLRAWAGGVAVEVGSGFSAEGAGDALGRGATLTSLVPTALGRLDPEVAGAFHRIVLGGQAPPAVLAENVVTTYGMTETGSGVVYDGRPLDGVDVALTDGGEILLRGPMLLRCYRDGTDPKTVDGWFATGDAGWFEDDGRLAVRGRIEDLIITGGENVWPAAVEPVIARHPSVVEAAVGGRRDPEWGERVTAFVVVADGTEPASLLAEVRDLVRDEVAAFAAPREIVIVDTLPRTAIGKIRRDGLTELEGPTAAV